MSAVSATSTSSRMAGRAREAAVRLGGLVLAIVIVVVVFTALAKPNTFLTFVNALGMMRYMSTIAITASMAMRPNSLVGSKFSVNISVK